MFGRQTNRESTGSGHRLRSAVGLISWLILLPIALFALGLWQEDRAAGTLASSRQTSAELKPLLAKIEEIAARNPTAVLTFESEDGSKPMAALVALSRLKTATAQADEELEISQIRRPLPWGTLGGSALALFGGLFGLVTASISGLRARRSQAQLIRSFSRLRILLPFILAVFVIGFCAATISAMLFEAISMGLWADMSSGSAKLFALGLVLAGVAAYSAFLALRGLKDVFTLFTPNAFEVSGRIVTEAEAPGLLQFVRDLATRQQALLPDTIIVGLTEGFFVTESQIRLRPEDRMITGRSLHLPAPYLELLDEPEIAAIIGHELAHFSGEDTVYSRKFTPIYAGFWRALSALRQADRGGFVLYPAVRLGFHALQQLDHAVNHWSRIREFEADRSSARSTSPIGIATALVRTGLIAPAIGHVLDIASADPQAADADLVAATARLVRDAGWPDPLPLLADRQPHPTDTHPPTIQRIQSLGLNVDEGLLGIATRPPKPQGLSFAHALFTDWNQLCQQLSDDYLCDAARMHEEHRQTLEELAAAAPGETIVYDNVKPMIWTMAIIAAICAGIGLMATVLAAQTGFVGHDPAARLVIAGITAAGFIACVLHALFLWRGRDRPLMILSPDGLRASMFDQPIVWTDIANYMVYASSRFALRLWLNPDAPLPSKDWWALYSKADAKKRIVTIGALGIRGMKAAEFSELVGRYLNAAYAARELSTAPPPVAAVIQA